MAAELAGVERARAMTRLRVRAYDDDLRASLVLFRRAADEAGGDDLVRAVGEGGADRRSSASGEGPPEAIERADVAPVARAAGRRRSWPSRWRRAQSSRRSGAGRRAVQTVVAALEHQPASETRRLMAQLVVSATIVAWWHEDLEQARLAFDDLCARAREAGDESSLPYLLVLLGQAEAALCRFEQARLHADEGVSRRAGGAAGARGIPSSPCAVRRREHR